MKNIFCALLTITIAFTSLGQDFDPPKDAMLQNEADFKEYEPDVLTGIDWIQNTPLNEQEAKRKEINAFLLAWMMSSPSVSIQVSQDVVTYMDCSECLVSFLSGWTKYSLENGYSIDKYECALAGTNRAIDFYLNNKKHLGKISAIEKLNKKRKNNNLANYIKSKI